MSASRTSQQRKQQRSPPRSQPKQAPSSNKRSPKVLDSDDEYEYIEEEEEYWEDEHNTTRSETFLREDPDTSQSEIVRKKTKTVDPAERARRQKQQQERDKKVEQQVDALIKDGAQPDDDMRDDVLHVLNRRKVAALFRSDYDEAQKYEDATQAIIANENDTFMRSRDSQLEDHKQWRTDQLKEKLRTTTNMFNDRLDKNETECNDRIRDLERIHAEEIREFKAKWKDPEFLKTFSRPSPKMLQMRHVEKKLAIQKKYMEAKQMKEIADQQQILEEREMQEHVVQQMRTDYQKMIERQQNEIDKVEEFYGENNLRLQTKMKKALEGLEVAIRQNDVPKIESTMRRRWHTATSTSLTAPATAVPTPRTQKKYIEYKGERNASLRIAPVQDSILDRLPTPKSRVMQQGSTRSSLGDSRFPRLC